MMRSLRKALAAEDRAWRRSNELRRATAPGPLQRALWSVASQLTWVGWLLPALVLGICAATALDEDQWIIWRFSSFAIADDIDYFGLLWTIQATVVALVYPLVISLVAILLQRRPGAAMLNLYLHDSGALVAGLSGVLLVAVMGVQYLFLPYLSDSRLAVWIAVDTAWFLLNTFLLLYFLVRTFDFIRPDRRYALAWQYMAALSWPQQARRLLANHIFVGAIQEKLFDPPPDRPGAPLTVEFGEGLREEDGAVRITRRSARHPRQLVQVRFGLLALALRGWQRALKQANREVAEPPRAVVSFPLRPFSDVSGQIVLCVSDNLPPPPWSVRCLVRMAFVYRRSRPAPWVSVGEVFNELSADALQAVRSGDEDAFRRELEHLAQLYYRLIQVSRVPGPNQGLDNLAALSLGLFDGAAFQHWSKFFHVLVQAAARRLPQGDDFVSPLSELPRHVFVQCKGHATTPMLQYMLDLPRVIWQELVDWEAKSDVAFAREPHATGEGQRALQMRALHAFVGDWEPFSRVLVKREVSDTRALQDAAELLGRHLANTTLLLLDSAYAVARNCTEWMLDVHVKWLGNLQHLLEDAPDYYWRRALAFVTLDSFAKVSERGGPSEFMGEREDVPTRFSLALKHAWIDQTVLALIALATWTRRGDELGGLSATSFAHLLSSRPLRPGGRSTGLPISNLNQAVFSLVRQRETTDAYRGRISRTAGRIRAITRPQMVDERMYTSVGDDYDILSDGALLLMMTLVRQSSFGGDVVVRLLEGLADDPRAEDRLTHFLQHRFNHLGSDRFESNREAYALLQQQLTDSLPFDAARDCLATYLSQALEAIQSARARAVSQRPVSPLALDRIAGWCHDTVARRPEVFPLSAFVSWEEGPDPATEEVTATLRYARGVVVEPPMEEDATNAEEFFAEWLTRVLLYEVMKRVYTQLDKKMLRSRVDIGYWNHLRRQRNALRRQGLEPLLVLEDLTRPSWVFDALHPIDGETKPPPPDMEVRRDASIRMSGYQAHIGGVATYSAPMPARESLLIAAESLERLALSPWDDGRWVRVRSRDVPDRPEEIELLIDLRIAVQVGTQTAYRLTYPSVDLSPGQ